MLTHPYNKGELIPPDTRVLIVGTAPPPRFHDPKELRGDDFDFFYGSEDNFMWEYLDKIAEEIDGAKLFSRTSPSARKREHATSNAATEAMDILWRPTTMMTY
jgi:hypothetical protein